MREGFNQYAPMPGVGRCVRRWRRKSSGSTAAATIRTEIAITTGTEGLFATLTALVHPGDEVVLFQPAYDSYTPAIQLSGGIPRYVTLRYPDYRIDWDEVRRTVTARTRVIVLNTPHNPTGMVWTADDVRALTGVLAHTDAIVVSDEVCEHVRFDGVRHESLARYLEHRVARGRHQLVRQDPSRHRLGGGVIVRRPRRSRRDSPHPAVGDLASPARCRGTPTPSTPTALCDDVTEFHQGRRDLFPWLIEGSRFRPLAPGHLLPDARLPAITMRATPNSPCGS
jgi:methionine aminotransferase